MKILFLWLLILAIFIFGLVILSSPNREGFESSTKAPDSTNAKNAALERFKYFKMLPEDNKWSQETVDAFKVKYSEVNSNTTIGEKDLQYLEKFATEEEAKIYIETGAWPINEYTKTNFKKYIDNSMKDMSEGDKQKAKQKAYNNLLKSPNSSMLFNVMNLSIVNGINGPTDFKGQPKFITGSKGGIKIDDTTNFKCSGPSAYINEEEVTDYKDIEKIPGFKFLQSPCNPCSNRCPYSYEDVTLPPYAVYWGISSTTGKSTPAEVPDDKKVKLCLMKANKKIIDMGGEPPQCP